MNIQKHWWKVLAVFLLLYSILAGLFTPLSAGIMDAKSPQTIVIGKPFTTHITCYNTFLSKETPRIWLKKDSFFVAADKVTVIDDRNLDASFNLAGNFPILDSIFSATIVLDSKTDGTSLLPAAISIVKNDSISEKIAFTKNPANLTGKTANRQFPFRNILEETIRNLYYHVPLWFSMLLILLISAIYSILYLYTKRIEYDIAAVAFANVGILFGLLGITTGMLWANYTWGAPWSGDVKQNASAVAMLIYFAYFILRNSFEEEEKRAQISATFNIFAFSMLIPLLFVIPRMKDSLHPGNGGNPAFSKMDLDSSMRMVFYPAVIAWMLFGVWIASLWRRMAMLKGKKEGLFSEN